jgi:hypothetical protein
MSEIGNLGTGSEITILPYHAITHITQVSDIGIIHYHTVLDLHCIADTHIIPYGSGRPDKTVRSYIAVLPNNHRADDVGTITDNRIFPHDHFTL